MGPSHLYLRATGCGPMVALAFFLGGGVAPFHNSLGRYLLACYKSLNYISFLFTEL